MLGYRDQVLLLGISCVHTWAIPTLKCTAAASIWNYAFALCSHRCFFSSIFWVLNWRRVAVSALVCVILKMCHLFVCVDFFFKAVFCFVLFCFFVFLWFKWKKWCCFKVEVNVESQSLIENADVKTKHLKMMGYDSKSWRNVGTSTKLLYLIQAHSDAGCDVILSAITHLHFNLFIIAYIHLII